MTDHDADRVFPGPFLHDPMTWKEVIEDGDARCCFCDQVLDDRRFAVGMAIRRAWSPGGVEYRFCHVDCLRKPMHRLHPLG